MLENSNKAILVNSIILYAKLFITTICSLMTTRFALKALGIVDFGLFTILGGILSLIAVVNTIMAGTTRRFIAVAIGKNNEEEINEQFNVNFIIQIIVAFLILIVALPIGKWYVFNYVNYDGNIQTAYYVFCISLLGAVLSFVGVAYHGLLTAKENFLVFSIVDVSSQILKLLFTILLMFYFEQKLMLYASLMSFLTGAPLFYYAHYCKKKYRGITKLKFVKRWSAYKDVLNFAKWNSFGAVACVAKDQGAGMIINAFFSTVMNASLGVANTINGFITLFSHNLTNPISPQITKSYASKDYERSTTLLILSTKLSYMVMFLISIPFVIETEYIMKLWLGEVPPYAAFFTRLIIVERLIDSLNNGIAEIVFANGKIAFYQLTTNMVRVLSVVLGFFALKNGYPPYYLLYCYIICTIFIVVFKQISLNRIKHINSKILYSKSYLPSIIVTIITIPVCLLHFNIHPLFNIFIVELYISCAIWFIGFNRNDRTKILNMIKR